VSAFGLTRLIAVMKISGFASQNVTHFRVGANQFLKSAHLSADRLFAMCLLYSDYFMPAANGSQSY